MWHSTNKLSRLPPSGGVLWLQAHSLRLGVLEEHLAHDEVLLLHTLQQPHVLTKGTHKVLSLVLKISLPDFPKLTKGDVLYLLFTA